MTRDLRRYSRQTNIRLLGGFLLILFMVGDALIWYFYGREAAILGLLCLAAGTAPLILIALILWGIENFVNRARDE
jgi:hypothetical protein